jgi:type IV pilus assembly protein PilM
MVRAVGLDIGSRSIKVVELSGSPKSFKVQRVAVREVPEPPEVAVEGAEPFDPARAKADVIQQVFQELKLPKDNVCATYDTGSTLSREIVVPFLEPDKIRKVVKFEAEHHLHSQSVDEVVVNWIKTGETKEGSRLTIFASSKEELVQRLAVMRLAGIEPASVDMDATAVYSCASALGLFATHPNAILLDVGAHTTALMLVVAGKPRMVRSFMLGVGSLPPMLPTGVARADSGDLLVTAAELEARTRATATAELAPREAHMEFVKKLHREVIRSLAGVREDAPPSIVYLSGGAAVLPEVKEALQERFGLPIETLNVFDHVGSPTASPDASYQGVAIVGAVGSALRMLGHNPLGTELLQDEFAPSNTFELTRTALATFVTLLFLLLLGLNFRVSKEQNATLAINGRIYKSAANMFQRAEKKYLQQVDRKDEATAQKMALAWAVAQPQDHTRIAALRTRLIQRHRKLQQELGMAKEIPEVPSATRVMYEIYKALSQVPRDELGEWFSIEKMDISERRCSFTLVVSDTNVYDTVKQLIAKSEYLRERAKDPSKVLEAQSRQQTKEGYASTPFEIKFKEQD